MSPLFIGRKKQILIGKESTYGTKASTFFEIPVGEGNLNPKVEYRKDDSAIGRIETISRSQIARKWSEPQINGVLGDKIAGLLMLAAFGNVSTGSALETTVYPHSFSVLNNNQHPSFTIIEIDDVGTKMTTGNVLNSLEFMSEDDFIRFNASFIGQVVETTTESPTWVEENSFVPKHRILKIAADTSGLAAADNTLVEQFRINFEKNAEAYFGGAEEPQRVINKNLNISGDLTATYEDTTLYDFFDGDTKRAISLGFTNTEVTIGSTLNPEVEIVLNRCMIEEWAKDSGSDDIVRQTMGFTAEYVMADGEMATGSVQNEQASY